MFRPYQGDYLDSINDASALRESIFRVVDFYSDSENIVFADGSCSQMIYSAVEPSKWKLAPRIFVLTNSAFYIFEITPPRVNAGTDYEAKPMPKILLRRRISLREGDGLESLFLSKSADPCVGFSISARPFVQIKGAGDKSCWAADENVHFFLQTYFIIIIIIRSL